MTMYKRTTWGWDLVRQRLRGEGEGSPPMLVMFKTDARNARSRAAIARLGASLDGVLRAHLPASDGGPRDSAVFSILEAEWPAVEARLVGLLRR